MKWFKTVFALLFSFSLIASQTVLLSHAAPSVSAKKCECCSCKQMSCCVAQPMPAPASQQTVPTQATRSVSQAQLQVIAAVTVVFLQSPLVSSETTFRAISPVAHSADVPLFVRNCSYLI